MDNKNTPLDSKTLEAKLASHEIKIDKRMSRYEQELKSQSTLIMDIYKDLKGGDYDAGAYKDLKNAKDKIIILQNEVNDMKPTVTMVKKTFWGAVVIILTAIGKFLYWLFTSLAAKVSPAVAEYLNRNMHHHS